MDEQKNDQIKDKAEEETKAVASESTAPAEPSQPPAPDPADGQDAPVQPPVGQPVSGYGQQPSSGYAPAPAKQPSPTGALVCGILAIVLCFIPIVGIVLGIVAIVLAGRYFKEGGTLGQGKAGRICGIIGIALSAIMIIVNCILIFVALEAMDSYSPSSYSYSSTTSATEEEDLTPEEEELFAVVNPEMDKLKNQDPQMLAMVAEVLKESIDEQLEGQDVTLEELGVDATELAKSMLDGFDYVPEDAYGFGTTGSVSYEVTVKSVYDVSMSFYQKVTDLMDDLSQYGSLDEAYKVMGQALMEAVNETKPEPDTYFPAIDIIKSGDSWTVDQESFEYSVEYIFEF